MPNRPKHSKDHDHSADSKVGELDETELRIVAELQRDGRITTQALAKIVEASEVTVRKKLRRLFADEIVRVVGIVDPMKVGVQSPALIGIKVERDQLREVTKTLRDNPSVRYVVSTTGQFHLYAEVIAETNQELGWLLGDIGEIPGVIDTETALILNIWKQTWDWRVT